MTGLAPLLWTVSLYTALVLARGAWGKSRDLLGFAAAIENYRLLPGAVAGTVAHLVPVAEAALALGLLAPATRPWAAAGASLLFALFAAAVAVNLARGRSDIDCGCGGVARPLSVALAWQNAVTSAVLAGVAILPATSLSGGGMVLAGSAALTAFALHLGAETLSAVSAAGGRPASARA